MTARAHVFDGSTRTTEQEAQVVDLHLDNHAVAQVSELPARNGFLIRVWPVDGTHEYGGNNMTILSAIISFDEDGRPEAEHIDWRSR